MKRILKARLRHTAVVSLKNGEAFRGVLFEQDSQALVLRNAQQLDPRSDAGYITADGEIIILVADVAYMQFI